MTKVYLKGLGLIGSSLARAIKKEHPDYVLIAEDQDHAAERYALEHGIADECGTAFDKAEDAARNQQQIDDQFQSHKINSFALFSKKRRG